MNCSIRFIVALVMMLAASVFAQNDNVYVRNVCDTLPSSKNPQVRLALAYVDETTWTTDYKYENEKDKKTIRQKKLTDVVPIQKKLGYTLPVFLTASCSETVDNEYEELSWDGSKWESSRSNNYASVILDIHGNTVGDFNEENTNNLLMMYPNALPSDESYQSSQILPSKTFEFQFEWWQVAVVYKTETQVEGGVRTTYSMSMALGNDYEGVMNSAKMKSVENTVTSVQFQVLHGILMDTTKIKSEDVFSSSSVMSSSSTNSSSSTVTSSSSSNEKTDSSSSGESSSSTVSSSSSNESTTGLVLLNNRTVKNVRVEMRRLDGTSVKNNENVVPGVYYVKGADGLWKKQMVLPH